MHPESLWPESPHFGVSPAVQVMLSRPSAPRTSVGPHHADDIHFDASASSVGEHHAEETASLMSYNIGFNNLEILSHSPTFVQKAARLKADITSAFTNEIGIQVLLISEFGNMFDTIDQHLQHKIDMTVVGYFENLI